MNLAADLWGITNGACDCPNGAACSSPGKHPAAGAPWDYTNANPRVRTDGDLLVIDLDKKPGKNGVASLTALVKKHGVLPRTRTVRTGSGGLHLYFKRPADVRVRNRVSKLGPGIDVRGDGGYVVAPGARHVSGNLYTLELDLPIAPAPQWLLELVTEKKPEFPEELDRPIFPPATPEVLADAASALAKLGPAIQGHGGDTKTFAACALLINDFALTVDEAWPLLEVWNEKCEPPWDEFELGAKLRNGQKYAASEFGCRRREDSRPVIEIVAGRLSENATQVEQGLIAAGAQIYQRGPHLVRPVVDEVDAAHGRKTKVARLRQVTPAYLVDLMSRHLRIQRFDARSKAFTTINPPTMLAETILSREGEWRFPAITGVITTPTLRPDGSILAFAGYDVETRLLLVDPPKLPPLDLSREGAEKSLRRLERLLSEFPFVDEASRSVALSAILTVVARGAIDVVPGHAASASTAGTGKSYLFDQVAAIAIGQRMPVLAAPRDDAEIEKRLGAAMLSGQPLISLDNMTVPLGGDTLAQLIERPVVAVRPLGKSELAHIESRASVFATGNNLTIMGDITRRVLLAKLEANMERPELRQFIGDPFGWILANRERCIADALTVVAAYAAAGRPDPLPRLASFGLWSDTVRSALAWLGRADPCRTMETARAEDPLLVLLRSAVATWSTVIGVGPEHALTASELLQRAQTAEFDHPEFASAIANAASNHGRPDVRTLGKWLGRHKDRITDGLRVAGRMDPKTKIFRWWLESAAGVAGNGGLHSRHIQQTVRGEDHE